MAPLSGPLCRESIGVPSVVAAMIALCVLLLTGVLTWDDCLSEKSAWDTLAWFAVLIGMSAQVLYTTLGYHQTITMTLHLGTTRPSL